jgi:CRP-like cAMP-binding protein
LNELLISARSRCETYAPEQLIELDPNMGLVAYVRSGEVLVSLVDSGGRDRLCVHRQSGTFVGIEALRGPCWPYELHTLTEVELWYLSCDKLNAWLEDNAHPATELILYLVRDLHLVISERIASTSDATSRVAGYLAATPLGQRPSQRLRKNVIARILQMRPETLSRVLRRLEAAGAVRVEPDLEVMDAKALERFMDD